jgi:deoxyribodipyrimidine photo-lyase
MTTRVLHWFRRDLRLEDNSALHAAARLATDGVVAVYVQSPGEWAEHDDAPVKIDFWRRCLASLAPKLGTLNIPLLVRRADRPGDIPGLLADLAAETGCDAVSFNREYEVNEARLQARVRQRFAGDGREVIARHDRYILPPGTVLTNEDRPYTVFTPFQTRLLDVLPEHGLQVLGKPRKQPAIDVQPDEVPGAFPGGEGHGVDPGLWPAGETAALKRLASFLRHHAAGYGDRRDFPGDDGTSALSPYLAAGAISPRRCLRDAMEADGGQIRVGKRYKGKPTGPGKWISELVWRDFYGHLVHHMPKLSMGVAMKPVDRRIPWRDDEAGFEAWKRGETGYPFVDAAMRQLAATGWMHNRVRMVVAMFLTKHLLIDWRRGERHFMRTLVDGDLASNNGGWQWSASTGADAAPYFRIYNPASQAERYDPDGVFIRRWVPELEGVEGQELFDPERLPGLLRSQLEYPEPIVAHKAGRERALEAFKAAGDGKPARVS